MSMLAMGDHSTQDKVMMRKIVLVPGWRMCNSKGNVANVEETLNSLNFMNLSREGDSTNFMILSRSICILSFYKLGTVSFG